MYYNKMLKSFVFSSLVLDTEELQIDLRARKVSGAFENGPQGFYFILLIYLFIYFIFFSFSNDIGNPCSCTPLIPLSVTFERLSNLMTFLCRMKYRYVRQAKRSAAL